jgi:hypothetical protein
VTQKIQLAPLNAIMVNAIIHLLLSGLQRTKNAKSSYMRKKNVFGYFYHLVNVISKGLPQSDPIKQCLL